MGAAAPARRIADACVAGDEAALAALAEELGFAEPNKTATNLLLLHGKLPDCGVLAGTALDALAAADPDMALNNLERLCDALPTPPLAAVLESPRNRGPLLSVLGASPFLTGLLCRDPDAFRALFDGGQLYLPKDEAQMAAELREAAAESASFEELQVVLRRFKRREVLRIGSRDLCGLAPMEEVTAELSALAGACLHRACEVCGAMLRAEYGAPMIEDADGAELEEAEFTVLGMGKLGGRELNFSSDIDLIYFYSSERGQTAGLSDARGGRRNSIALHQYFCKLSELVSKAVGQVTEDGFVFRVDLRLRPEGERGEMANSLRSAEIYYESWGQSWERAALIKARPVAGSIEVGERLLKNLEPFVYRRYLDYGMLEDMKVMKGKIDRSLTREREGERNLKLGRGGIREVEFFIQALQIIFAGKNPLLRERNSLRALDLLLGEGLIGEDKHRTLREAYIFLRNTEHRIQMEQERQTHNLPARPEEMKTLARRCGFADAASFQEALEAHRGGVQEVFRDLFFTDEEQTREQVRPEVAYLFDPAADPDQVKDLLEEKGFGNPDGAYESLQLLRDPQTHLTRRGRRHLERIAPLLIQEVLDSPEPDMALANLERFLGAVRARASFFALLGENREIIKVLVSLFGTSQFLSRIFIQHPEILDALVSRAYALHHKERREMEQTLQEMLEMAGDYEESLEALRRYRNEEFLRIAMGDILGHMAQGAGARQLSNLADVCLHAAWQIARAELVPRFGLPFCGDGEEGHEAAFAIVALGKLGGRELNYHSDLDIIFVHEGEGETRPVAGADPERFRPQSNQEYFSRLAQRIISVLTLMTREGTVYQIDTRLRPSGNQGPLVTSLPAYESYHRSSAQLWERQALVKARVVAGPAAFARSIAELNCSIVYESPLPEGLAEEIRRLRQRMETEIAREDRDRFNIKTGRGGIVDVEFLAQYLQLLHGGRRSAVRGTNTLQALKALRVVGILDEADLQVLEGGYKFLRRLENKLRLVHDQSISELSGERRYLVKLARRLDYPEAPVRPDQAFLADYRRVTEQIRAVFDRFLPPSSPGEKT
ncbi:MAG: bifunctional [glutamate--ammonia ligase]-adenylyl-L-tyrosine phosphorylase/[glutamate--ammonia-ligase] adenylyltransferase [Desulfuromonas sp.]|uniref:bifunctional [glutamate--ammonia ligase]-adenylyl-L-tyrosine phosphorylase/[glutamate--ammonia-ligase] adenylyltransferase n=1 Tax=Desulfuromonas sp. TaxID=892 RepID=UPI000CBFB92F|nr:bifunctional [glutamate--ammonia ligase]-adenylyl-L-tyrosine phosphorylase/[glutamate--ammonia-ligase] adenylyltransferase [Desulfuromonas sp.]PLX85499.1 MAG: bifunctional [glutamate--ammonia ligase]-adenylyl-L-tyrosine phosphorylase/[glutamate--ammonia-ligase] adenylyltransferase [Desulfuromonas sp.]